MTPSGTRSDTTAARTPVPLTTQRGRRALVRLARAAGAFVRVLVATGLLGAVLAGVPYLLHGLAPDPWPEHRRSWNDIRDTLLAPTTDQVLIDTLAAASWIAWAGFALSILAELGWYLRNFPVLLRDASAHRAHQRAVGVWRAPATWLAGLLIVALVAMMRATHTTTGAADHDQAPPARPAAAVASLDPATAPPLSAPSGLVHAFADASRPPARTGSAGYTSYTVRPGDTLWDIAAEQLGDPIRWPQIYALSRHLAQPGDAQLTNPDVIHPGWILHLPTDAPPPPQLPVPLPWAEPPKTPPLPPVPGPQAPAAPSVPDEAPTAPPQAFPPGAPAPPPAPTHDATAMPPAPEPGWDDGAGRPALDVPTVGLLGATLAAGIGAAMLWARRHRRRAHPDADPARPTLPPVLSAAHRARRNTEPTAVVATETPDTSGLFRTAPLLRRRPQLAAPLPVGTAAFAIRGDTEIPLDAVAAGHGIGLTGPGALGAARAIAAAVLHDHERARPASGTLTLLLADADAAALLGEDRDPLALTDLPHVRQLPDTEACLTDAERHLLTAAHQADADAADPDTVPVSDATPAPEPTRLVLLTRTAPQHRARLAGIAAAGAADRPEQPAVTVVVLDAWPVSCRVDDDGTITTHTHPNPQLLDGARALHLTTDAFGDVTDELFSAHGWFPTHPALLPTTAGDTEGRDEPTFFARPPARGAAVDPAADGLDAARSDGAYAPTPDPDGSAGHPRPRNRTRDEHHRSGIGPPPQVALPMPSRAPGRNSSWPTPPHVPQAASADTGEDAPDADDHPGDESDDRPLTAAAYQPEMVELPAPPPPRAPSPATAPPATAPRPPPAVVPPVVPAPAPPPPGPPAPDQRPPPPEDSGATPVLIHLLGPFRIDVADQPAPVGTHLHPSTREFLAILATHPDGIRTAQLADHLDLEHADPTEVTRQLTNLRRAVRRLLRDATGHTTTSFVISDGDRHHLDPTAVHTDLARFTTALDRAAHADDNLVRAAALEEALAAYTGDLLDGADYPWAEPLREHHRRRAADAAARLAELATTAGHPDRAIAWLDRAIDHDLYNEPLYQCLIRLQTSLGRDDAAQRTFDRLTVRLAELDTRPDPATRTLLPPHHRQPQRRRSD
ncbi:LysM peptidoglycan-binding domain-containing protein [Streptomycetaceae bacterium NBC_01309]